MRRSGWEAPTYPSFDFRPSAEKSLVLSLKRASARTPRARRSGTGPGRWVDLASLKASRPRMYARGRAGRPRSRHFTAKRWSKTKLALHTQAVKLKEVGGDIPLCPERRYKNPHLALPLALTPTLHVFCELLQQAKDAARQPYQKEEVVVPRLVRMDRERDRRR